MVRNVNVRFSENLACFAYLRFEIRPFALLPITEACLDSCQTSMMEHFNYFP